MRTAKKGSVFYDIIPVLDIEDEKATGLSGSDFTPAFYLNGASVSAPSYAIAHIANGDYAFSATFTSTGAWTVIISIEDTGFVVQIEKIAVEVQENTLDTIYAGLVGGIGSKTLVVTITDSATGLVVSGVLINVWNNDCYRDAIFFDL